MIVLELIGGETVTLAQLRASYRAVATGAVHDHESLARGEDLLRGLGLIEGGDEELSAASSLFGESSPGGVIAKDIGLRWFLNSWQPWIANAVDNNQILDEFIPEATVSWLRQIFPDVMEREASLLAAGRRWDAERAAEIGQIGEDYVVNQCKKTLQDAGVGHLASQVRRVSLISDQLGYDISSPTVTGDIVQLEVKTFTGPLVHCFLSRNEFQTGSAYQSWRVIFCQMQLDGTVQLAGWCSAKELATLLPQDAHDGGRWSTAELWIPRSVLKAGLPLGD